MDVLELARALEILARKVLRSGAVELTRPQVLGTACGARGRLHTLGAAGAARAQSPMPERDAEREKPCEPEEKSSTPRLEMSSVGLSGSGGAVMSRSTGSIDQGGGAAFLDGGVGDG